MMPHAVTLRLDPSSTARVERTWRTLAERVGAYDALRLGYPPHLTLAVVTTPAPAAPLAAVVRRLAATWRPLPLTLVGLAVFPGPPPVL